LARAIDRADASRRPLRRPHHLPRRLPQHAGKGHIDFLEIQLDLIGLEGYTQSHVDGLGEGGTPGLREAK
jgi:bacterioferritin (cytochrome b1)